MAFSSTRETIQIATFAGALARKFDAVIHLAGCHHTDEDLEAHTRANQFIVQRMLSEYGIRHEIVTLDRNNSYEFELINYAKKVNADVIAATHFKQGIMSMKSFIQEMIDNDEHIPVLTISDAQIGFVSSHLSFMQI